VAITTLSSREFNQNRSSVKQAAAKGPVIVTDRGKPCLVVMKYEDYEKMREKRGSLLERLYMPCDIDIDFDPARLNIELKIPDFDTDEYADAVRPNQTSESRLSQDAPEAR